MLTLEKKSQLEALHRANTKESLTLEYKASPAVDKRDDTKKLEIEMSVRLQMQTAAKSSTA
jgi:hypothetical protein